MSIFFNIQLCAKLFFVFLQNAIYNVSYKPFVIISTDKLQSKNFTRLLQECNSSYVDGIKNYLSWQNDTKQKTIISPFSCFTLMHQLFPYANEFCMQIKLHRNFESLYMIFVTWITYLQFRLSLNLYNQKDVDIVFYSSNKSILKILYWLVDLSDGVE